jgi:hypothetical protein
MSYRPHMATKVRSTNMMAAFEDYFCTMRISGLIEGHRCSSQATVVGVHPERLGTGGVIGKGTGTKASDLYCMAGCFNCHNLVSGVDPRINLILEKYPMIFMQRMVSALHETLALHIDAKVLIVPDGILI